MTPLEALRASGQSVWLDFVQRSHLTSGGLERLIAQDGVTGVTSNPVIFQKAIGDTGEYDAALRAMTGLDATAACEALVVEDIRLAADQLRPVYDRCAGQDGHVSLEVSPSVADDLDATLAEAHRLWARVDRPNLMIKIPGTAAGVAALRPLIAEGLNVNVTLLFGVETYLRTAESYMAGLEDRLAAGRPITSVASVASFFVSRIDTQVDALIDALARSRPAEERRALERLKGRAAIANAAAAYGGLRDLLVSPRWAALAAAGAQPQRLLWASTSVKNPAYADTLYVSSLAGPLTVNTLPPSAMDAFRDHGRVRSRLLEIEEADVLRDLVVAGVNLEEVAERLLTEGLAAFDIAMIELTAAVDRKLRRPD